MKFHLPAFEKIHIVVVGDVMLDRYWHGGTHRISPEAPVPVFTVQRTEERAGGAGNVALNVQALGCQVSLCSLVGNDKTAEALQQRLEKAGINCYFEKIADASTITKLRIIDKHQQLIRLDFEQNFQSAAQTELLHHYQTALAKADAVILSDYAKGTLKHIREFIRLAKAKGIPILVDPKSEDFNLYAGATVITPNLKEFETVAGRCQDAKTLEKKARDLLTKYQLEALLITQGEHGMTLIEKNQPALQLSAHVQEIYDVTGAGDTVISVLGASLAAGESLATGALFANIAAGIVVKKLGAATVSIPELRRALQRYHASEFGVLTEEEVAVVMADARAHGEIVVMTNGCFDILHPGHIAYLEEARALGQRLVVAVNDDTSVAHLKGAGRPINSLEHRMRVLAALRAVDWVVPFTEDTPARLIGRLLPDILVKGGDYQLSEIAGADAVLANGGEVKVLQFVDGYSTASIIKKITKLPHKDK